MFITLQQNFKNQLLQQHSVRGCPKELLNTCPKDGLLTWLVYSITRCKHFNAFIVEKLLMQILELLETGDRVKGKVLWYENQIKDNFEKTRGDISNMYVSEVLQFFEPLKKP